MKLEKNEGGIYFFRPVTEEETKLLEALSHAIDAFNKAFYPEDLSTVDCKRDQGRE